MFARNRERQQPRPAGPQDAPSHQRFPLRTHCRRLKAKRDEKVEMTKAVTAAEEDLQISRVRGDDPALSPQGPAARAHPQRAQRRGVLVCLGTEGAGCGLRALRGRLLAWLQIWRFHPKAACSLAAIGVRRRPARTLGKY